MKPRRRFGSYQRIYIFPNRFGFIGFALFLVILVAGGTYQNNLVFMMGFLLLSLGLVAILQTARNIRDLEYIQIYIEPNFAGESTTAWLTLKNKSSAIKLNIQAVIELEHTDVALTIPELEAGSTVTVSQKMPLPLQRGQHKIQRLRLKTQYPYSLFQAWTFLKVPHTYLVYPALKGSEQLPTSQTIFGDDFTEHKNYQPGDNISRVDWKIYSRTQKLLIKEFNDGQQQEVSLRWDQIPHMDKELKLSQLALWIALAEKMGLNYQLIIPGFHSPSAHGVPHQHQCLERLALQP